MLRSRQTLALTALLLAAAPAFAGVDSPNANFIPPNEGVYISPNTVWATYSGPGLTIVLSNIVLDPTHSGTTNPPPNEVQTFLASLSGQISVNGSPNQPTNASGVGSDEIFNHTTSTGTFNTEMLQLDLNGSSPFGPYMIRESPTLASTGQTTVTPIGGGLFHIDSFFDVFTELSVDGGNSWIPSQTSTHVTLESPEPTSLALLALGALPFLRRRRS